MKKLIAIVALIAGISFNAQAQDAKTISLEQTKGEFTQKNITVTEGDYVFEISNNNVGTDVGFVLVKKGQDVNNPENHIKSAYVTKAVSNNTKGQSNITTLSKGEYVYFCPLNKTGIDHTLTVE